MKEAWSNIGARDCAAWKDIYDHDAALITKINDLEVFKKEASLKTSFERMEGGHSVKR